MNVIYGCGIEQMAVCVPKNKVIIQDKRFSKIVGIKEKRVCSEGVYSSDLALAAAKQLDLTGVKFIVFSSQTHDRIIPFVSNKLQHELGLGKDTGTMDIISGCTGFILGLLTAFNLCQSSHQKVLFVIADTLYRTTGNDPASEMIFGDGAAACVIGYDERYKDSWFNLYSDGSKAEAIRMDGWAFKGEHSDPKIYMDGDLVLNFAIEEVPKAIYAAEKIRKPFTYVFHQSNKMILDYFEKHVVPHYVTMPRSIEMFGNTSGASIPITLTVNQVKDYCLLCGYGSGLTWGTALVELYYCDYKVITEI